MTDAERIELIAQAVRREIRVSPEYLSKIRDGYTPEEGAREIARLKALPDSAFPLRWESIDADRVIFRSREEAIDDVRREVRKTAELRSKGLIS